MFAAASKRAQAEKGPAMEAKTAQAVKGGLTRVSLAAEIQATRFVPEKIVDYVAARALTRATAWVPRSKGAGASD